MGSYKVHTDSWHEVVREHIVLIGKKLMTDGIMREVHYQSTERKGWTYSES